MLPDSFPSKTHGQDLGSRTWLVSILEYSDEGNPETLVGTLSIVYLKCCFSYIKVNTYVLFLFHLASTEYLFALPFIEIYNI